MCFTVFPVLFVTGPEPLVLIILAIIVLEPVVVFFSRVRQYYTGMWYEIREGEMSGKRGVWFQTTGVVPYNRITNPDVKQGPVMRVLMDFHACHPDSRLFRPGSPEDTGSGNGARRGAPRTDPPSRPPCRYQRERDRRGTGPDDGRTDNHRPEDP